MLVASLLSLTLLSSPIPDAARIQKATGGQAVSQDGVVRVERPRTDVDLYVGGIKIAPAMELTAWAAFKHTDKGTLVVGQLPLTEEQAGDVERLASELGLEVTGLDDHFSGESPRMAFLHFMALGDEGKLAGDVGKLFVATFASHGSAPALAQLETTHAPLTVKKLAALVGQGQSHDGTYRVERPRALHLRGQALDAQMGAVSWAAFTGSDDSAAVAGAFTADEAQLQPVLKVARSQGLVVTSIDSPWVGAQPSVRLVHFWGTGGAEKLARAVQAGFAASK
jgi:hypothetical protein